MTGETWEATAMEKSSNQYMIDPAWYHDNFLLFNILFVFGFFIKK